MKYIYQTDGKGKYWRCSLAEQCPEEVFFKKPCQGVKGHKGGHWCYDFCGSYRWTDNKLDPQDNGCSMTTPPDHHEYVSPQYMSKFHYSKYNGDWEEVTDKEEIENILKQGSSLISPVTDPKILEMLKDRL